MYVLYKKPVQVDTLAIVRYLFHEHGFDARPSMCIERAHPAWVTELPSIMDLDDDSVHVGFEECVKYFEKVSGVGNLAAAAKSIESQMPLTKTM